MGATSITRAFSYHLGISNRSKLVGLIGAVFFMASDTILAINKFHSPPIPNGKMYVMITYYIAQALIASSAWPALSSCCPNGCSSGGSGSCGNSCQCAKKQRTY